MLLLLIALAHAQEPDPAAFVGPLPEHEVLRPVGLHTSGIPVVPGPPSGCQAKAQVYVPWKLCKDLGAPQQGEDPLRLEARALAVPPLPAGTRCALVCTPGARLASWSFLVPANGYRGRVACPVSPRVELELVLAESTAQPSEGATVQWQTDLVVSDYVVDDPELMDGDPDDLRKLVFEARRVIEGPTACPSGQPVRR